MKRFYLSSISAGLAMALISGPLAFADQGQDHASVPSHNASAGGQHGAPAHNGPQHMPSQAGMSHPSSPMRVSHSAPQMSANHAAPQSAAPSHNFASVQHQEQRPPFHPSYSSGHHWNHGDHFYGNRVVIENWNYYQLQQPPYGYEWVQDGDQFVLIALATGIITDIIINSVSQ
jgi:Ni/Co efflux regulator RcnB